MVEQILEHVSQFNQRMVVHSKDETLMCKIFPSSLGPVATRWFEGQFHKFLQGDHLSLWLSFYHM